MNRICLRNTLTTVIAILLICSAAAAQMTGSRPLSVDQRPLALPTTSETTPARGTAGSNVTMGSNVTAGSNAPTGSNVTVGTNGVGQNSQQIPADQRPLAQPSTRSQQGQTQAFPAGSPRSAAQPAGNLKPANAGQRTALQTSTQKAAQPTVQTTAQQTTAQQTTAQQTTAQQTTAQQTTAQQTTAQQTTAQQTSQAATRTAAPTTSQTAVSGTAQSASQPTSAEKPLAPPAEKASTSAPTGKNSKTATDKKNEKSSRAIPGLRQLLVATGMLALLFVGLILLLKKLRPQEAGQLPKDVFEVLGKSPLAFRQQVYFLRGGDRIFLIALSANGVDKIGEITDSAEVARITQRCHGEAFVPVTLPTSGTGGANGNVGGNATGQGGFANGQVNYGGTSQTGGSQTGASPQGNANGTPGSATTSLEELYRQTMRR